MEKFEAHVGQWSKPVKNEIEKGAIRKFAQAIGDDNPLYVDEEKAAASRYGRIIAPPTFARTLDYGEIGDLDDSIPGLIHADERYRYARPIVAGEVVYGSRALVKTFSKTGKLGAMTFLVFQQKAIDEAGNTVVEGTSTIIYRG